MTDIPAKLGELAAASPWAALLVFAVWAWFGVWLVAHFIYQALLRVCLPFPFLLRLLDYGFPSARLLAFFVVLQAIVRHFGESDLIPGQLRDLNALLLVSTLTWFLVDRGRAGATLMKQRNARSAIMPPCFLPPFCG